MSLSGNAAARMAKERRSVTGRVPGRFVTPDSDLDAVLARLSAMGPPYLFASYDPVSVGSTFMLGEQAFVVDRLITVREYRERYPLDRFPVKTPVVYFEGRTD